MAAHTPPADITHSKTISIDNSTSSKSGSDTSDTSKSSPSSTPPSDEKDREVEVPAFNNASYSSNPPRRPWRLRHHASSRLGAIDEDSSVISPDVPMRNPLRNFGFPVNTSRIKFVRPPIMKRGTQESEKPPGPYDELLGPNGEKFVDVRQNKRSKSARRGRRNCFILLGLGILLIAIGLGVGLGVGLTRRSHINASSDGSSSPSNSNAQFPAGLWAIGAYLTTTNTSCTPNASTWRCYPYKTYNDSAIGSLSTLDWSIVRGPNSDSANGKNANNWSYLITNTNPTFSYPFANVSLQPSSSSGSDSAFTFSFTYRKTVIPSTALTSDGAATRCYYDNVLLSATLYTERPKDTALNNTDTGNGNTGTSVQSWPYALEYIETISDEPHCFKTVNGNDGDQITLSGSAEGQCECKYTNYGV